MLTSADVCWHMLAYACACPAEVKNTPDITRMHINGNNLRVVPPDVKFLTQVTVMTMDSNEIKSISPDLAELTQLTELSAAHNKLEAIPVSCASYSSSLRPHTLVP